MTKKVLIADDEWELRNLIKLLLEDYDLEFFEAENSESALEMAMNIQGLELIMLDNNMPGLTGYEIIQKLKVDPNLKHIPIVMMTGKKFDAEMQAIIDRDVNACLMKPFDEDRIISAVEKVFGKLQKKGTEPVPIPPEPPQQIPEVEDDPKVSEYPVSQKLPEVPPLAFEIPDVPLDSLIPEMHAKYPSVEIAPVVHEPSVPSPEPEMKINKPREEVELPEVQPFTFTPEIPAVPDIQSIAPEPEEVSVKKKVDEKVDNTRFYIVAGITLKRLICIVSNIEPVISGQTESEKSMLLISYGDRANQRDMNLILDIFGASIPVVTVPNELFGEKIKDIRSLGGSIFEINPEALRKA
jgi:CheY-like chemotaxis protein